MSILSSPQARLTLALYNEFPFKLYCLSVIRSSIFFPRWRRERKRRGIWKKSRNQIHASSSLFISSPAEREGLSTSARTEFLPWLFHYVFRLGLLSALFHLHLTVFLFWLHSSVPRLLLLIHSPSSTPSFHLDPSDLIWHLGSTSQSQLKRKVARDLPETHEHRLDDPTHIKTLQFRYSLPAVYLSLMQSTWSTSSPLPWLDPVAHNAST